MEQRVGSTQQVLNKRLCHSGDPVPGKPLPRGENSEASVQSRTQAAVLSDEPSRPEEQGTHTPHNKGVGLSLPITCRHNGMNAMQITRVCQKDAEDEMKSPIERQVPI